MNEENEQEIDQKFSTFPIQFINYSVTKNEQSQNSN